MSVIDVPLEFPLDIIQGLATGKFERIGGVIRDRGTKQVFAWLRDGGEIANNPNIGHGFLGPLLQGVANPVALGLEIVDIAATAHSHHIIMQQLGRLESLVQLSTGVGVVNIAVTAISTGILYRKLNKIENQIQELQEHLEHKDRRDREAKLKTALGLSKEALDSGNPLSKQNKLNDASSSLLNARNTFETDIRDAIDKKEPTAENNLLIQQDLIETMYIDLVRVRCMLEESRDDMDIKPITGYMDRCLKGYDDVTKMMVKRWRGDKPASYFHSDTSDDDLLRFLGIEHWLREAKGTVIDIILEYRDKFWNKNMLPSRKETVSLRSRAGRFVKRQSAEFAHNDVDVLTQAELVIENYQRLQSFSFEIEQMNQDGLTFAQWEDQQKKALASRKIDLDTHDDYVLLVDEQKKPTTSR